MIERWFFSFKFRHRKCDDTLYYIMRKFWNKSSNESSSEKISAQAPSAHFPFHVPRETIDRFVVDFQQMATRWRWSREGCRLKTPVKFQQDVSVRLRHQSCVNSTSVFDVCFFFEFSGVVGFNLQIMFSGMCSSFGCSLRD